ncbi:hypothetical protein AYI70_g9083 [Smittium culicis]|uniref:BZIP domain-containing protein n=1 Tax=Smittium culicis TaxID=133412 RepID=A0A1R1XCY2_9FUNG|nr:hypothetical protein AYI70_g9083 [Smittium culicis]
MEVDGYGSAEFISTERKPGARKRSITPSDELFLESEYAPYSNKKIHGVDKSVLSSPTSSATNTYSEYKLGAISHNNSSLNSQTEYPFSNAEHRHNPNYITQNQQHLYLSNAPVNGMLNQLQGKINSPRIKAFEEKKKNYHTTNQNYSNDLNRIEPRNYISFNSPKNENQLLKRQERMFESPPKYRREFLRQKSNANNIPDIDNKMPLNEKLERRLQRNRVAAKECRLRKKKYISGLEATIEELKNTNSLLLRKIKDLENQINKR